MIFDEAVKNITVNATPDDKKVDVVIFFETAAGGIRSASMTTKRYFTATQETLDTLKRAWGYACKSDPTREENVISIEVYPTTEITAPVKNTGCRISA